ncbi:MAG: YitT family protein, partial [Oscillospiraceae bacterium]|nr:YitT family protein [Oscillospiraceae bacterium]
MLDSLAGRLHTTPETLKRELKTFFVTTFGSLLYCIGTVFFVKPALLPSTGVMGICLLLNYAFGVPLSISNLVLNLALFAFAFKVLPKRFSFWTLYSVVAVSFFMEVLEYLPKPVIADRMLLVIAAAVLHGIALAVVFSTGGSTGGMDIISMAMRRKYGIELGSTTMYLNFAVILMFLTIVPFENAAYGFLLAYVTSLVLNGDLRAFSQRNEAMIITDQVELVRNYIITTLHRGVTIFPA